MIGERLKHARVAAGLSMRELGEQAGLSAMAISKIETGKSTPTSGTLLKLARALGVRTESFFRPELPVLVAPEYRKRSTLPRKQLARVQADVLDQVERFLEVIALFPEPPVVPFEAPASLPKRVSSMEAVEDAAEALREAWHLGTNAIPCLADTLEERGFLVLTTGADESQKLDGMAATVGGFPIVVVGATWPGDRQRFTMAHELGHLVLEGRLHGLDEEKACNRFAGAFLAPREAVRKELGSKRRRISAAELLAPKHEFGLSMGAWIFRAKDVGVLDDAHAVRMYRLFRQKGWHRVEPGPAIAPEQPKLFDQLVLRALAEDMVSTSKAAELLGLSTSALRNRLNLEAPPPERHEAPRAAADQ